MEPHNVAANDVFYLCELFCAGQRASAKLYNLLHNRISSTISLTAVMSDHLPLTAVILVSSFQENVKYFPVIGCRNDNCAAHKAIAPRGPCTFAPP